MDNEQMKMDGVDAVPTFTPPTPTFTPPVDAKLTFDGRACYYHKDEPAVKKCARCGRHICQDCYDNYSVIDGPYQGEALCYDCCRELVASNVSELQKNKAKIKGHFILSIIGMILGAIFMASYAISNGGDLGAVLVMMIVGIGIGGVFLTFVKYFFRCLWEAIKEAFSGGGISAAIGFVFALVFGAFKCVYFTIRNTIEYIIYLRKTSGFIESDSLALEQMKDYMEYTLIRNQNRGVDIATLLNQKSELADNMYARMVHEKGEEGAEAVLRDCVATINENGEIIRSFNNRAA